MPNNAKPTPRPDGGPEPDVDEVAELQRQVDRLEDLLSGIQVLAGRYTTGAPSGFRAWIDENFDAIHGVPRSDDDERYSALLDEIEAACPEARPLVHELDAVVGSRLCQHMDHVAAMAWNLLGGEQVL